MVSANRLILLVGIAVLASQPAWGQDAKRVLMLHSFGTRFTPFNVLFAREMRTELWPEALC